MDHVAMSLRQKTLLQKFRINSTLTTHSDDISTYFQVKIPE